MEESGTSSLSHHRRDNEEMDWTRREKDWNGPCRVKNQVGSKWKGHVQGKEARKRQEFLAYQICDPLLQWWMSKASSDLSLLLICLAGALFRAEQGWTLEHVTPVAARSNPLTVDSWACRPIEGFIAAVRHRPPQQWFYRTTRVSECVCHYVFPVFPDLTEIPQTQALAVVSYS